MHFVGYLCIRPRAGKREVSTLSLSIETHDWLPGTWCLDWVSRSENDPLIDLLSSSQAWISDSFDSTWGWPGLIFDHAWAVDIQRRVGAANGFVLIGIGCSTVNRLAILGVTQPTPQLPGFAPMGQIGLSRACQKHREVPLGHSILGWEVIMVDRMTGFSESLIENSQLLDEESAVSLCAQQNAHPQNGCWPWFPFALLSCPSLSEEVVAEIR